MMLTVPIPTPPARRPDGLDDPVEAEARATGGRATTGGAPETGLEAFLKSVERRALRMAELACGQRDQALDLVQDAMFGFVRNYAKRPSGEWPPLFHRVLDNRLTDWHRRQRVRGRWMSAWFTRDDEDDPLEAVIDTAEPGPLDRLAGSESGERLDAALRALPLRQRQAFLLRIWEGLDVEATAIAMRCSEGSVKTHLSRALSRLRERLGDLE